MEVLQHYQTQYYCIVIPLIKGFSAESCLLPPRSALSPDPILPIESALAVPSHEQPSLHIFCAEIVRQSG